MNPLRIEGETRRLAEEQPEYHPLSIRDEPVVVDFPDGPQTVNGMTAAFQPTPDELERINTGAPVYVRILGVRWPPASIWVGEAITLDGSAPTPKASNELRTMGADPFGDFKNLVLWFGPASIEPGREAIANCLFAVGTDGLPYYAPRPD